MSKLIGLSTGSLQKAFGDIKALEIAKACGADAVDFDLDNKFFNEPDIEGALYSKGEDAVAEYYRGIKKYADGLGLFISQTHGRCTSFCGKEDRDEVTVVKTGLDCLATATLGAPACVVHSVGCGQFGVDYDIRYVRDLSFDLYMRTLPFARKYGVKIAAENFGIDGKLKIPEPYGMADEIVALCERVEATEYKDDFTFCVDTGHANAATPFGQPSAGDVIRLLKGRFSIVHLHDNDCTADQHHMPMCGKINWKDTVCAFDEVGFDGVYNMELNLVRFGKNVAEEYGSFAVKVMKNLLANIK